MVKIVTEEFIKNVKVIEGDIRYADGYYKKTHEEEIELAKWLCREFGGEIVLLGEVNRKGMKTPDCVWLNREWEFKTIASSKFGTIDLRIRKAYAQIRNNRGGMVLDFSKSCLDLHSAVKMVERSAQMRARGVSYVIVKCGGDYEVLEIRKK